MPVPSLLHVQRKQDEVVLSLCSSEYLVTACMQEYESKAITAIYKYMVYSQNCL